MFTSLYFTFRFVLATGFAIEVSHGRGVVKARLLARQTGLTSLAVVLNFFTKPNFERRDTLWT
jgi:uncharacterized membrane protein